MVEPFKVEKIQFFKKKKRGKMYKINYKILLFAKISQVSHTEHRVCTFSSKTNLFIFLF